MAVRAPSARAGRMDAEPPFQESSGNLRYGDADGARVTRTEAGREVPRWPTREDALSDLFDHFDLHFTGRISADQLLEMNRSLKAMVPDIPCPHVAALEYARSAAHEADEEAIADGREPAPVDGYIGRPHFMGFCEVATKDLTDGQVIELVRKILAQSHAAMDKKKQVIQARLVPTLREELMHMFRELENFHLDTAAGTNLDHGYLPLNFKHFNPLAHLGQRFTTQTVQDAEREAQRMEELHLVRQTLHLPEPHQSPVTTITGELKTLGRTPKLSERAAEAAERATRAFAHLIDSEGGGDGRAVTLADVTEVLEACFSSEATDAAVEACRAGPHAVLAAEPAEDEPAAVDVVAALMMQLATHVDEATYEEKVSSLLETIKEILKDN
ncbi:unnamed protein product [Pedinophyceae sp. YPF-701]|nr:unnamed protein product [Pedinophyceae sp. YPF-701]